MAPIIEVSDETLRALNPEAYKLVKTPKESIGQVAETSIDSRDLEGYIFMPGEITPQRYGDLDINSARVSATDPEMQEIENILGMSFDNMSKDSMQRSFIGNIARMDRLCKSWKQL